MWALGGAEGELEGAGEVWEDGNKRANGRQRLRLGRRLPGGKHVAVRAVRLFLQKLTPLTLESVQHNSEVDISRMHSTAGRQESSLPDAASPSTQLPYCHRLASQCCPSLPPTATSPVTVSRLWWLHKESIYICRAREG